MRPHDPNVKRKARFGRQLDWCREHPIAGWYLASILALNTFLNILDVLDIDPLWFTR